MFPPERIVCLTEETTETLYLLGEEARIVGISGYTVRPPRARKEKPRVSAFISADVAKITALEPDLVLAFSDMQAEIVAELIRKGIAVHCFNQRSIAEILDMIRDIGRACRCSLRKPTRWLANMNAISNALLRALRGSPSRPKIYFEEWDEPMISGIAWVSELIGIAGGVDVFAERSRGKSARERFVTAGEVIAAAPEIIVASWCGKKFRAEKMTARPGFDAIPAVKNGRLHEIKSPLILQPGPAALTDGLKALETLIG